MRLTLVCLTLGCTIGCTGTRDLAWQPAQPLTSLAAARTGTETESPNAGGPAAKSNGQETSAGRAVTAKAKPGNRSNLETDSGISPVNHRWESDPYEVPIVESPSDRAMSSHESHDHGGWEAAKAWEREEVRLAYRDASDDETSGVRVPEPANENPANEIPWAIERDDALQMNLPTALSMVGGQHPIVGFAQWRVQEAYAELAQAEVLWLPSLRAGVGFHRHDGNIQASDGTIVDLNRNSFQYGLGVGANAAGTTLMPGVVAQFHLADAIFRPEIAQKTAWARGHAANGVVNTQLRDVAVAYLGLLRAHQDLRILQASRERTEVVSKLTGDFAETGQGLRADADRLRTELELVDSRLARAREEVDVASARLAQAMSFDADQRIAPMDPTVVPIELVSSSTDKVSLIRSGLVNRPELKESQALVAAAYDAYRRQRTAPFIPSVLLGFSTGGFGGGLGNNLANVEGRYDFDALVSWEVRNFGFGERAARREANSRVQQARHEKLRVMDQVAREVSEAHAQIRHRAEQVRITRRAIAAAEDSYRRNLERIRDGQGLPLEVLQSVQALEETRRAYLDAVIDHNESQFRLQWALGYPVDQAPAPVDQAVSAIE